MNRAAWQQLAEERIAEAKILLAAQKWSGAYYLAGYAVECALKSCILARVEADGAIFREKKFSERCWTHDLLELLELADLEVARDAHIAASLPRKQYWDTVEAWNEHSRYVRQAQQDAEKLMNAIDDPNDGVLLWIKSHW